jgi:nucleoside-diphosphate-sugar epimerase
VKPVVVDVYDRETLAREMQRIKPSIVIHQLTDLPAALDPKVMALPETAARNARLRIEGTHSLADAALAGGAARLISQSIAWAYAAGTQPHGEDDALDLQAEEPRRTSVQGVAALEDITLNTPGLAGTVLRYGHLYGPHTGFEGTRGASPLHVEAAAQGALLALQRTACGIFNFCEDNPQVSNGRARRELGWTPELRLGEAAVRRAA